MSERLKQPLKCLGYIDNPDKFPTEKAFKCGYTLAVLATKESRPALDESRQKLIDAHKSLEKSQLETFEARQQALLDPLTGCWNMRWYEEYMNDFDPLCGNNDIGMAFVDIDDFGRFNKEEGQQMGDLVLQEMATHLQLAIRGKDCIARIGGDEFVIIFSNQPTADRKKNPTSDRRKQNNFMVSNLLAAIESKMRHIKNSPVSYSWGCAVYDSSVDNSLWDTQERANEKMKLNKSGDGDTTK